MRKKSISIFILFGLIFASCGKSWLDVKRDQKLVVPQTLSDLQALLNNSAIFNVGQTPSMGEVSTPDFYVLDEPWSVTSSIWQKNAYIWKDDIFEGISSSSNGWDLPYRQVFYANVVLEGIEKISRDEENLLHWDNIKGTALFWRSWAFHHLTQLFCKQYDDNAENILGIPLPLESDVNIKYGRSTLKQSYERILNDLNASIMLLPEKTQFPTLPSKVAAYGLISRVYLYMGNYQKAYENAKLALVGDKELIDYNDRSPLMNYPFEQYNSEVILEASLEYYRSGLLIASKLLVDTILLKNYLDEDLRKNLFFNKQGTGMTFKGTYSGSIYFFSGISVDEVYLTKMECAARLGKNSEALDMLNYFLERRIKRDKYIPKTFSNTEELLQYILLQRHLQLVFRGLRWSDIKRLNIEEHNIILERKLNGQTYRLEPNSNKYVLPIPPEVIAINPLIVQNDRN